jgi:hypothetical protein
MRKRAAAGAQPDRDDRYVAKAIVDSGSVQLVKAMATRRAPAHAG